MKYALDKIDTVAACDALLTLAQKKKQVLERKTRNLGATIATFRKRLDSIGQEMTLVESILIIFTAGYNALPEKCKYKPGMNAKIKRLEYRQAKLQMRAFTCNERALLEKEVKYNMLLSQLSALNTYIAAVQKNRVALSQGGLRIAQAAVSMSELAVHHNPQQVTFSKGQAQLADTVARNSFWNSLTEKQGDDELLSRLRNGKVKRTWSQRTRYTIA